ncbi:MAG: hypothetical protein HY731_00655 [Candidatus Tectomicrobia bacterium]|nr:hypothetical protein [Candidatus Tectomicrobia bacterium]
MKTIKGIYKDGLIEPLEDPKVTGPCEVYIFFPEEALSSRTIEWKVSPASLLQPLIGLVSLGGDALEDTEKIYDQSDS